MAKHKTICFACQKGGVGKTTVTMMVADALSRRGHKVLVVDTDPQASAYKWECKVVDGYQPIPVRVERVSGLAPEAFGRWLEKRVEGLDYLLIDTPPALASSELRAALFISDMVVLPVKAHTSSSDALEELDPLIKKIEEARGSPLDVRILFNMYNSRRKLEVALVEQLPQFIARPVFETKFRDLVAFADAYNCRTSIYELPDAKAARQQVEELIEEIIHG